MSKFQLSMLHWENYISISFHVEWDMILETVFLSILNKMEFHLVKNKIKNCHQDHIPFNLKVIGNIVYISYYFTSIYLIVLSHRIWNIYINMYIYIYWFAYVYIYIDIYKYIVIHQDKTTFIECAVPINLYLYNYKPVPLQL